MSDEPRFGLLDNAQPYGEEQLAEIARAARPFVLGPKDAGKVYCPFCKLREARWRRALDPATPRIVDLFVYCTQCHKTGVTKLDLDAPDRVRFPRALIVLAILWTFVVFSLRSPVVSSDGLQYAIDARAGEELWNPHHLLQTGFLRAVFSGARAIGEFDLLEVARATSAPFFALLLIAVALAVLRRGGDRRSAVLATFAVGSSFGFMQFAAQPEPYAAAIAFGTLGFALAPRADRGNWTGSAVGAGFALAGGALFHQLAVLAGVAVLVEAALRDRASLRRAIAICAGAAAIVSTAYLLAWRADVRGESFLGFLTRYSSQDRAGWGDAANLSLTGAASLGHSLRATFCGIARDRTGTASGLFVASCFALIILAAIARAARAPSRSPAFTACVLLAVVYEAFCWWWIPTLAKYQLFAAIPLLVVSREVVVSRLPRSVGVGLERVVLLGLVISNLVFCLAPERSLRHLPRERAFALASEAGPGGVVVCDTETAQFVEWDSRDVGFVPAPLALANAGNGTLVNSIDSVYDPLAKARRIVVPLLELKPNYAGGGLPGPVGERLWLSYLSWIFGLRTDREGNPVRRRFEVVRLAGGEPAIALDPERAATGGPREIVLEIDRKLAAALGAGATYSFARHFETAGWTLR